MRCPRCGRSMIVAITPSDAGAGYDRVSWYCDNPIHQRIIWIDVFDEGKRVRYTWTEEKVF